MSSKDMDHAAEVSYFAGERNSWGMTMRRSVALLLPSIFLGVACATTVPLDLSALLPLYDGGTSEDAGGIEASGGFATETGGYSAGGFMTPSGGAPSVGAAGRPSRFRGAGGRTTEQGTGGASFGTGGARSGSGGAPTVGGSANGTGGASCRTGEKVCGGVCVSPAPRTGCGTTGCTPCANTAPANGVVVCNNGECDFSCLSGYTKSGNSCTAPMGTGGSTGGGGAPPGPAVSCGGTTCPSCSVILGPACCNGSKCGCPLIPWTAGFLGCI